MANKPPAKPVPHMQPVPPVSKQPQPDQSNRENAKHEQTQVASRDFDVQKSGGVPKPKGKSDKPPSGG